MSDENKSVKLTLAEAVESVNDIAYVLQLSLPMNLAHRLSFIFKTVREHVNKYEEIRARRFEEWGEPIKIKKQGPQEPRVKIKDEYTEQFLAEMKKYLEEEIVVPAAPVKPSELPSDVRIPPVNLMSLQWLFKE